MIPTRSPTQRKIDRAAKLVRQLRQPRLREADKLGDSKKSSDEDHPSKRPLNEEEEALYAQILVAMEELWTEDPEKVPLTQLSRQP